MAVRARASRVIPSSPAVCPGPAPKGTPTTVSPSNTVARRPAPRPASPSRSPGCSSSGSLSSAPGHRFGLDVQRVRSVMSWIHCGAVPRPRPRSHLAPAPGGGGPHPPGGQGQPLLPGATLDGPEGQSHAATETHDGQDHPDHGRPGADGQHPYDQPGGHRGDLTTAPAGDHPPTLERREAVADPGTGPSVRNHQRLPRRHAPRPQGPAGGTAPSPAAAHSADFPSPTG